MAPYPLRAERFDLMGGIGSPSSSPADEDLFPEIDGTSSEVRRLKRDMWCVARDPEVTALILGESGTGKERVARAIHRVSPRANAPFVVIDCAGLSPTLAEDALFGHVRGAFTGAVEERAAPFERANGGTVLLDEVGELSLELQTKLLRAVQSRTIQRLGGRQEVAFDVRILAATNVDLDAATARGRFRQDLYYRLKVYEIRVPPLRRRGPADVRALITVILGRLAERRRRAPPAVDPQVLDLLLRGTWPGNVRELENTLERMLVRAGGETLLTLAHLPEDIRRGASLLAASRVEGPPTAEMVREALERSGFRFARSAADLGLSRHQLYRLVKRYGIRPQDAVR